MNVVSSLVLLICIISARVDINLTSHWREEGDYSTLVINITKGYPEPITLSQLKCNERLMNYTLRNSEYSRHKFRSGSSKNIVGYLSSNTCSSISQASFLLKI